MQNSFRALRTRCGLPCINVRNRNSAMAKVSPKKFYDFRQCSSWFQVKRTVFTCTVQNMKNLVPVLQKRQIAIKNTVLLVLDFRTCLLLDSLLIANKENIFRCQLTIELRQQCKYHSDKKFSAKWQPFHIFCGGSDRVQHWKIFWRR